MQLCTVSAQYVSCFSRNTTMQQERDKRHFMSERTGTHCAKHKERKGLKTDLGETMNTKFGKNFTFARNALLSLCPYAELYTITVMESHYCLHWIIIKAFLYYMANKQTNKILSNRRYKLFVSLSADVLYTLINYFLLQNITRFKHFALNSNNMDSIFDSF